MPAAIIVRQIFELAAEGMSTLEIARILNVAGTPSPNAHKNVQTTTVGDPSAITGRWYARTVERILENEIYIGRLIQGKTKTVNFQRQPAPSDEWIYANNAHESIISHELFQAVQSLRQKGHEVYKDRRKAPYTANLYKGRIYCACCGGRMERKKNHDDYVFYCVSKITAPESCKGNRISELAVNCAGSKQLILLKEELIRPFDTQPNKTEIFSELRFLDMEINDAQNDFRILYENMVTGAITQTDYLEQKHVCQTKMDYAKQRVADLQQLLNDDKATSKRKQESIQIINEIETLQELTLAHVDRFVNRVVVFRDGRVHIDLAEY